MRYAGHMCAVVVCSGLIGLALIVAPASADFPLPGIGGDGGAPFRVDCGEYGVLVGVSGQSGVIVDSIAGLCVKIDPISGAWRGAIYETARHGGKGGSGFNKTCPVDTALAGLNAATDKYNDSRVVSAIDVFCMKLDLRSRNDPPVIVGSQVEGPGIPRQGFSRELSADHCYHVPGQFGLVYYGIGLALEGRSGFYVDRIHLVCGEIIQDTRGYRISFQPSSKVTVLEGTPVTIAWSATGTTPALTPNLEYAWGMNYRAEDGIRGFGNPCAYAVPACGASWVGSSSGSVTFNSLPPSDYELAVTVRPMVGSTATAPDALFVMRPSSTTFNKSFPFTIRPNLIASLTFAPDSIHAGSATTATVKLEGPVSPKGRVLYLASSDPNLVAVPATIAVPGGADKATFNVRANPGFPAGGQATVYVSTKAQPIPVVAVGKSKDISIYSRGLTGETQPEALPPPPEAKGQPAEKDVPESEAVTERGVGSSRVSPKAGAIAPIATVSGSSPLPFVIAQDQSAVNKTIAAVSAVVQPADTKQAVLKVLPNNIRIDKP